MRHACIGDGAAKSHAQGPCYSTCLRKIHIFYISFIYMQWESEAPAAVERLVRVGCGCTRGEHDWCPMALEEER